MFLSRIIYHLYIDGKKLLLKEIEDTAKWTEKKVTVINYCVYTY